MPTKCDSCGKESYVIYITRNYERLCDICYDKDREYYKKEGKEIGENK
jgi:hypothetical protein